MKFLYVGIGGAIGAIMRYLVAGFTYRFFDKMFPWGTLTVNLMGALLIGFLYTALETLKFDASLRIFIFVGILGAFTTFSTYCMESVNMVRNGNYKTAFTYMFVSNISGLIMVILGIVIARLMISRTF